MEGDIPLLHPEDDGRKKRPPQDGELNPITGNISSQQLLQIRVMQAAADFARTTGLSDEYTVKFDIETEDEKRIREHPVFDSNGLILNSTQFSQSVSEIQGSIISLSATISVLSMMSANAHISDELKGMVAVRLEAIAKVLTQMVESASVLNIASQEMTHIINVQSQIDEIRKDQLRAGSNDVREDISPNEPDIQ